MRRDTFHDFNPDVLLTSQDVLNLLRIVKSVFRDIANLLGGFDAWKAAGLPFTVP